MASEEVSRKRGHGGPCQRCKKIRRKCVPSELDPGTCTKCRDAAIDCSFSRMVPHTDRKRKIEDLDDVSDQESSRLTRAISPVTTSHNLQDRSIIPSSKKPQRNKPAQPATITQTFLLKNRNSLSSDACGICQKEEISSGETKGDKAMLKCDIKGCARWYHLSCIQFKNKRKRLFQSLATGIKKSMFICPECFDPDGKDLVEAVGKAESDLKLAIERAQETVLAKKEARQNLFILSSSTDQERSPSLENDAISLGMGEVSIRHFEPAKEKYEGFERGTIESLLHSIEEAVYNYDREITGANELFLLPTDEVFKSTPLKVWNEVDPGYAFLSGMQWFHVDSAANNLSQSHAPITAALRQILGTPDDSPLTFSSDLENLSFSHVHVALVNWFIVDILNNALNLSNFPNMKPLRAMRAAVSNFGDARWKGHGRRVLREIQLRAWHKNQFCDEVIEKIGWNAELIRRLESFTEPLTKRIGRINPRSESRANIIKYTLALWTYLDAADGQLQIIHPVIGDLFDGSKCENAVDELQVRRLADMKVKWVLRRGFRFAESCVDGRTMSAKALVSIE